MKDLIENIAKRLVEDKETLTVSEREEERGVVFVISVAQPDMGRIIGKEGRIAKALRTIVRAISIHQDKPTFIEIVEAQ